MGDLVDDVAQRMLKAVADCREGRITPEELRTMMLKAHGEIEASQWKQIEDLRTNPPEDKRELARALADLFEAELRKGVGNA